MGDISRKFDYWEFFVSRDYPDLAKADYKKELDNNIFKDRFKLLALNCLQPVRDYVASEVKILSGYRGEELNKKVGGVSDSGHRMAIAADFTCAYDLETLFKWCMDKLCYRKIIYYPDLYFIHVSMNHFDKKYRHDAYVKINGEYKMASEYFISKG